MNTSFTLVSGNTVSQKYSWDYGMPFSSASPLLCTAIFPNNGVVTGYAPGVKIFLNNNSTLTTQTTEFTAISSLYYWDFGDYYNDKNNNYIVSSTKNVSHVYIMPGSYSATLTQYETGRIFNPSLKQIDTIVTSQTFTQPVAVVSEVPPVAGIYVVSSSQGTAPFPIQLTARVTKAGSFPIEKIVWDFGDGSPLLTVSRYATAVNEFLVQTNVFNQDLADPRNFDPIHIYQRSYNTYAVFYPSITAYSSSTNSYDTCSFSVGPIFLPTITQFNILKNKLTPYGSFYALKINNKDIAFVKTLSSISVTEQTPPSINIPVNPLRNSQNFGIPSNGVLGSDYYTINITY